jgi:hypothetical protein
MKLERSDSGSKLLVLFVTCVSDLKMCLPLLLHISTDNALPLFAAFLVFTRIHSCIADLYFLYRCLVEEEGTFIGGEAGAYASNIL